MVPDLTLLRWHITKPGRPQWRAAEEIIDEAVVPAVNDVRSAARHESLYVSKHAGYEVWLTVFVQPAHVVDTIARVEPKLSCLCFASNHIQDSARDEILLAKCAQFRTCIDRMTRVALDLHAVDRINAQRDLIRVGCKSRSDRSALEPILLARSPTYAALPDRNLFWTSFSSNCLSYQTDCGHWLYNIVLGIDGFAGLAENDVANQLSIAWP